MKLRFALLATVTAALNAATVTTAAFGSLISSPVTIPASYNPVAASVHLADTGLIVGNASVSGSPNLYAFRHLGTQTSFITVPTAPNETSVSGVSNDGIVAGVATTASGSFRPFTAGPSGSTVLESPPGLQAVVLAANDFGFAAGISLQASATQATHIRATIWNHGTPSIPNVNIGHPILRSYA